MAANTNRADDMERFAFLSEKELDDLISSKDSQETKKVIRGAVNVLRKYCTAVRIIEQDVERKTASELNLFFRNFSDNESEQCM